MAGWRVDPDPLLQYGINGRVTEDSPSHPMQLQDQNWRRMKPGTASQVQARLHNARLALRHGIGRGRVKQGLTAATTVLAVESLEQQASKANTDKTP